MRSSGIPFFKVSGGGNDFVALAEPGEVPTPDAVRAWCRRALSVGADGVFVLRREGPGRVAMQHFNPDGSIAALCLNGTRCAGRLAFALGWASQRVEISTGAGAVRASKSGRNAVALELPPPEAPPEEVSAAVDGEEVRGWLLTVGVPHLVLPWPASLRDAPVETLGAKLVHHPAVGEAGANVDFVRYSAPGAMEIRTYERGVNAETLSCGTGVLSSAAVGIHLGKATLPLSALTRGGFRLVVEGEVSDDEAGKAGSAGRRIEAWSLAGDARIVARGELLPGALELPSPPCWT